VTRFGRLVLNKSVAGLLFLEVVVNSLWIARVLSSIPFRPPLDWMLFLARAVVTALELTAAGHVLNDREAGPVLASRVLLASAVLVTVETGFRLMPTNLDPTFKWWVVALYWMYAISAGWALRSGRSSR
jgi:hypothetical protein